MQAASGTLLAAIQSRERTPVARVKVDWNRDGTYSFDPGVARDIASDTLEGIGDIGDLSPFIDSLSVDRSLATDLPEAAKINSGFGAAEAGVSITGQLGGGVTLVTALSAASGSGANAFRRLNAPITIDVGFVGSAGPEYLRQFTGKIRSVAVDPVSHSVNLTAIDGREDLRTPVQLPITSGQDGAYFITQITTANGVTPILEASLNTGISTPALDSADPWSQLQQIAGAEQGVVLFDENGTLRFYNRNHMGPGSPVATITTDPSVDFANLKALAAEESIDTVSNDVSVHAAPLTLDAPNTIIWEVGEVLGLNGFGFLSFPVEFAAPLHSTSAFAYVACTTVDGLGTNVTNLVLGFTQTGTTTGTVTIYNPNAFAVFLVFDTAVPGNGIGTPALQITGRLLRPTTESGYTARSQNARSQGLYGVQTLDVSGNPWLQSAPVAGFLAEYLATVLADPSVTLTGVDIVGDPRLQLADRVRVTEPDGLMLDSDYWIVGLGTRFSTSDGLAQSVTLREA